ncbi:formylglycine-generating enzyme family protein [Hymenobacter rubripertinctus]|nr:SUMF1/EgtB/PvdO family nonheme iron enzyme [Hymenobacter rubripertinctus]
MQTPWKGYDDYAVLEFGKGTACQNPLPPGAPLNQNLKANPLVPHVVAPGCVLIRPDGLSMDETEVTNNEWRRYQMQLRLTGQGAAAEPSATALPVPDYYTNPFYDYAPVVGLSYEQVTAFCRWRGRTITHLYNADPANAADSLSERYVRYELRLPTEAEWERAALADRNQPYGTSCPTWPLTVNPRAAAYLRQYSGTEASPAQVATDIKAYNQTRPVSFGISCRQPKQPYFLRLLAPAYVFQTPANDYGLYQLLGNAAEMVQERGISKGGSYLDPLEACTVTARGTYAGPAPNVGFRCVSQASYPNRK